MATQAAPLFGVGDTVYFKESAQQGFLEAIKISTIHISASGQWSYHISFGLKQPDPPTFGDRITHQRPTTPYFNESELITFCDAAQIIESVLTQRLAEIQRQRAMYC